MLTFTVISSPGGLEVTTSGSSYYLEQIDFAPLLAIPLENILYITSPIPQLNAAIENHKAGYQQRDHIPG